MTRTAPQEDCQRPGDEDADGLADCADVDCPCPEACDNGLDDDRDGARDCADFDCDCPEACGNVMDDDRDGKADCDDPDCQGLCPERCDNGWDDDGDGAADCADHDCLGQCPEWCGSGLDADADGLVDCLDPDCEAACREGCAGGQDDDADGLVDCADPECEPTCDADQDGHVGTEWGGADCDDGDATVHPGSLEVCDGGIDNDCNDLADDADPGVAEGTKTAWHIDSDADGWGRDGIKGFACAATGHQAALGGDCADHDAATHPDAAEICDGLWDEDCDGLVDEDDPDTEVPRWWYDDDGDGWGGTYGWRDDCEAPDGHVDNFDDCDDHDPAVGPAWLPWFADNDSDGFGAGADLGSGCFPPVYGTVQNDADCDDADEAVFPDQTEVCDGTDQDCDDLLDHDDDGAVCAADPYVGDPALLCDVVAPWLAGFEGPSFGQSVDVAGNVLAVGQPGGEQAGRVWTWTLRAGGWEPDGIWVGEEVAFDSFGASVALVGDRLWVGAPGTGSLWSIDRDTGTATASPSEEGRGQWLAATPSGVWTSTCSDIERWTEADGTWTTTAAWPAPDVIALDADGDRVLSTDGALVTVWQADGTAEAAWPVPDARTVAIHAGRAWIGIPGGTRAFADIGGVWVEDPPPEGPTVVGIPTAAAASNGLVWLGVAGEPGIAVAYAAGPAGIVEAFALNGPTPVDHPVVAGDATPLANCLPFGAGGLYGPFAGFAWQDVPAFTLRPGDTVAFDLWAPNDVPIEAILALAPAMDGTDVPAGPFDVVATGQPANPLGNSTQGDFELAWTADRAWDFAGGGLLVRIEPTGAFATDDSCTAVVMGADADGIHGGVGRFWADPDGEWPWDQSDALRVAAVRVTLVGRAAAFGTAVSVSEDILAVTAPASAVPAPENGTAVICRPASDPPAW